MVLANHLDMDGGYGDDLYGGDIYGGVGDLLNHLETLPIAAPLRSWNYWSPQEPPERGKAPGGEKDQLHHHLVLHLLLVLTEGGMSSASGGEGGRGDQGEGATGQRQVVLPAGQLRSIEASPEWAAQHLGGWRRDQ